MMDAERLKQHETGAESHLRGEHAETLHKFHDWIGNFSETRNKRHDEQIILLKHATHSLQVKLLKHTINFMMTRSSFWNTQQTLRWTCNIAETQQASWWTIKVAATHSTLHDKQVKLLN